QPLPCDPPRHVKGLPPDVPGTSVLRLVATPTSRQQADARIAAPAAGAEHVNRRPAIDATGYPATSREGRSD
ncbi:MAG TPA: hypothetical protein VML75_24380, partial [Kofleriaceae bacterium]|nr:hypothetical protein [Kofleriaceae bacterium]